MAEQQQPPTFSPSWRYNPVKHQLQLLYSPTQGLAFEEGLLRVLEALPLTHTPFAECVEALNSGDLLRVATTVGGWRNCSHGALLKLPMSTR